MLNSISRIGAVVFIGSVATAANAGFVLGSNASSIDNASGTRVATQSDYKLVQGVSSLFPSSQSFMSGSTAMFSDTSFVHGASFAGPDLVGTASTSATYVFDTAVQLVVSWDWHMLDGSRGKPQPQHWSISRIDGNSQAGDELFGLLRNGSAFSSSGGIAELSNGSAAVTLSAGTYAMSSSMWGTANSGTVVMSWVPVPTPGAMALIGIAGVAVAGGRRRS